MNVLNTELMQILQVATSYRSCSRNENPRHVVGLSIVMVACGCVKATDMIIRV